MLIWGVATFLFTSMFNQFMLANVQGGDTLLRVVRPHERVPGDVLGWIILDDDSHLVIPIWYASSGPGDWKLNLSFVSVLGNVSYSREMGDRKATSGSHTWDRGIELRGPANWTVVNIGLVASNITDSRLFVNLPSKLESLAYSPHGVFLIVAGSQFVGVWALVARPQTSSTKARLPSAGNPMFMEGASHFLLAAAIGYTVFYLMEGIPIEIWVIAVFWFFPLLIYGSLVAQYLRQRQGEGAYSGRQRVKYGRGGY